jgi:UDP-glucose 4-epimerase
MGKTLVTGGAGFIGSHLTEELLEKGREVVVLDDLSTGKKENLPNHPNLTFIEGSITDRELLKEIFSEFRVKTVFHLAALPSVELSVKEPVKTHKVNCDGTIFLLEESKKRKVEKFVFASSAAVYGNRPELPKKETDPVEPLTPYGIDKLTSELYTVKSFNLYGLKTVALRFFNVYGERQNPSSPYSGVISIFINRFVRNKFGEDVPVEIFGDGNQTRDFVYVKDVVRALLLSEEKEEAVGRVFNVGTGVETSVLKLVETLKEITGISPKVVFRAPRKGDIKRSYADISNLKSLGYHPRYPLTEGLRKTFLWELEKWESTKSC